MIVNRVELAMMAQLIEEGAPYLKLPETNLPDKAS